jgi:hypothetical protein
MKKDIFLRGQSYTIVHILGTGQEQQPRTCTQMVSPHLCHDVLFQYDTITNAKLSIFVRYGIQQCA